MLQEKFYASAEPVLMTNVVGRTVHSMTNSSSITCSLQLTGHCRPCEEAPLLLCDALLGGLKVKVLG